MGRTRPWAQGWLEETGAGAASVLFDPPVQTLPAHGPRPNRHLLLARSLRHSAALRNCLRPPEPGAFRRLVRDCSDCAARVMADKRLVAPIVGAQRTEATGIWIRSPTSEMGKCAGAA
jgi:hypothetical protein